MLDFTIAAGVGIIEFSFNSYQNLAANKLNLDFLGFTEKVQKKGSEHMHRAFWKKNIKKKLSLNSCDFFEQLVPRCNDFCCSRVSSLCNYQIGELSCYVNSGVF